MLNKYRKNPLACGLLGVLIGSVGTLGGQALLSDGLSLPKSHLIQQKSLSNFDLVPYDENGDVYITAHGKKYYSEYCYILKRAKKVQKVNSSNAESAGLEPCSKCLSGK